MGNEINSLIGLISKKTNYKVGKIISRKGSFFQIEDTSGAVTKVSGDANYTKGAYVLVENEQIIGSINKSLKTVFVP